MMVSHISDCGSPFDIEPASASKLRLARDMNTVAGAGTPFTQPPLVVLQDEYGNTVIKGDKVKIFAMIGSYRSDPKAPNDLESTDIDLFGKCTFDPISQDYKYCEVFSGLKRHVTLSIDGMADLTMEDVDGNRKPTTLHVKIMGYYTIRFYAEALVAYSSEFFVMNDLGATMKVVQSPGPSSCSPGITGHNDWRCASGGLLDPQPRLEIYDQFENRALYGVQEFRVEISQNLAGGYLICDQRYWDEVKNKPIYTKCKQASRDGILQFTDLRIDSIGKSFILSIEGTGRSHPHKNAGNPGYWSLPVESKMVKIVNTDSFDVSALRSLSMVSEAETTVTTIPAGCPVFPAPTMKTVGFRTCNPTPCDKGIDGGTGVVCDSSDCDPDEEKDIVYTGGTGIVFGFGCTAESSDVVLQTGRAYLFANGVYMKRQELPCVDRITIDTRDVCMYPRPSYELDVSTKGPGAIRQHLFYCKNAPDDGTITIDSGCHNSGFWRIFSIVGFCGNISHTQKALQFCETGIGANTLSLTPDLISLRSWWLMMTPTSASQSAGGDIRYEWTKAEKDSIWFSRDAQPCVVESSMLQGATSIAARDGSLVFDKFQINVAQRYTLRFKFNIPGSASSFAAESTFLVTQGQIGSIHIVESLTRGLVNVDIDPPILIQPLDLYGNPIRGWDCTTLDQYGDPIHGSHSDPPQWYCTSKDLKLALHANVHSCDEAHTCSHISTLRTCTHWAAAAIKKKMVTNWNEQAACSSLVPIKDPVAAEMSLQEYSTGLKFRFRPAVSTTPGQKFVFRVQVNVTNAFEGCPGSGPLTRMPAPVVAQTEPFEVDNSRATKIVLTKQPPTKVAAGQNIQLTAKLFDANDQIMALPYSMRVSIGKESSQSCTKVTASRSSCPAGYVYRYCSEPVVGNELTTCYFQDQVEQINTLAGAHFTQLVIKAPGTYFLFVFIGEPWLETPINSSGYQISVVSGAPDAYIGTIMQPWTKPPETAKAGDAIAVQIDFGLVDQFGNFMTNYDYFYPIEDLTIKSNAGIVWFRSESCDSMQNPDNDQTDNCKWILYENQRIIFKATPPQGPLCGPPPSETPHTEEYYPVCGTGLVPCVCGTYQFPHFMIGEIWGQVDGVKTDCSAKHFLRMEGTLVAQPLGTGLPGQAEPSLPKITSGPKISLSALSFGITVSPADAAALALYFTPLREYARKAFSDQPKVQLIDRFKNPVCELPAKEEDRVVHVRACSALRDSFFHYSQETLFLGLRSYKNTKRDDGQLRMERFPNGKAPEGWEATETDEEFAAAQEKYTALAGQPKGFPSHCPRPTSAQPAPSLSQNSVNLENPGAFVMFSGLFADRTGDNKLYFLAGPFSVTSNYIDVASGDPSGVVIVQAPQASVSEELIISGSAPAECPVCISNATVGTKILDIAGNDLTDPATLSVSVSCSAGGVMLHGTKRVASTHNGYAAFTDLRVVYSGPAGVSSITCNLTFQTTSGPPYTSNAFTVSVVYGAQVMVLPTTTVVHRLFRGNSADGRASAVIIEARDFNNQRVRTSRRAVHVSGLADSLSCCCYLGDCKVARLQEGSVQFPSILSSRVSPNYTLSFNLTTPFSTISVRSAFFAVVHDAPSRLVVTKGPSAAVPAGSVFEVRLQVMLFLLFDRL